MAQKMRVTGGMYSGRRIVCPPGIIRPAMDRMRESVFAILGNLSGSSFLDLFCGSGIIGIEAASRGAEEVIFVEKDRRKLSVLQANTGIVDCKTQLVCRPAEIFLSTTNRSFDVIFADPPFAYKKKHTILETINSKRILSAGGSLLIHYPSEDELPEKTGQLMRYDLRKYGRSIVGFYTIQE